MVSGQISLSEALTRYLSSRHAQARPDTQQELTKFIRWGGWDRSLPSIKPHEAAEYGDYVASEARQDAGDHLQVVKDFLTFCYKSNFTETSLAKHIKVRKAGRRTAARESARAAIDITEEGYQSLLNELEKLKGERVTVAQEISRAAADKDFRENAPLDAARDRQGLMEARIRELEDSVQRARLVDGSGSVSANQRDRRIKLGSIVRLTDPASQEEMVYTLVNASEASPMDFKMSVASPVGKALMDHHAGDEVEVATPRGSLRYRIDGVD
jgi:transcription elongation factor GreA